MTVAVQQEIHDSTFLGSVRGKNIILKYNLNTSQIDTLTSYSFLTFNGMYSSSNIGRGNTTSMIKMGDNFIVGGHFHHNARFGNIAISQNNSTGTDMFIAKFGTTQCIFCDTAIANFTINTDSFSVLLNNTSILADSYTWLINDSIQIDSNITSYNFTDTGTYAICLIAENDCSADTLCQTTTINCANAQALFTLELNGLEVSIENNGQNTMNYTINWGDSTINTNLEHIYQTAGNYEICLIAENPCSVDTSCINVEVLTGIQEKYNNGFVVNMYPNPAKEELNISLFNIENNDKTIKIYNIYGQKVKESKLTKNEISKQISLKELNKGVYFVVVEVEGSVVWSKKLIVE